MAPPHPSLQPGLGRRAEWLSTQEAGSYGLRVGERGDMSELDMGDLVIPVKVLDTGDRWSEANADEILWWPRILWIDPGTVSGVAVVWFDPRAVLGEQRLAKQILAYSEIMLTGPEIGPSGVAERFMLLARLLSAEGSPGLAVGSESFIPRQMNMSSEFLSPVRITAMISYGLSMEPEPFRKPLYKQSPSDALGSFGNDRLRPLRMYTPGPDHMNDAKRHCLLWVRKLSGLTQEELEQRHGAESGWWEE